MNYERINRPKKTWGIIELRSKPGHFHTGYVGYNWRAKEEGNPAERMEIGVNVIITGDVQFDGMSRGHSAANFQCHFRGHEDVTYDFAMSGALDLIQLLAAEKMSVEDGYIRGQWTIAKQGMSMFLKPASV